MLAAFAGLDIHAAASPGSCMAKAVSASIGNSYSVTLVDEWDPESDYTEAGNPIGGNTGSGVFWYKVVISKYAACSIWIDGISSAEDSVYMSIETDPNDEKAPWASFTLGELEDGTQYGILPSDGWDAEDPSSGTYYIHIDGEIGDSMTLHIESGVKDFSLVGSADNPVAITVTDSWKTAGTTLWNSGSYFYTAKLEAGNTYQFYATGGTRSAPCGLYIYNEDGEPYEDIDDEDNYSDYNDARIIVPSKRGWYIIEIYGGPGASCALHYRRQPGLPIEKHDFEDLDRSEEGTFSATFTPGRMRTSPYYFDNIIDEKLFHVVMQPGERCIFETQGATTNILIMVYDGAGDVLATNYGMDGGLDVFASFEAKGASTNYYVGVCRPDLDVSDTPSAGITLTLKGKVVAAVDGSPDEWDAKDDVIEGATELIPAIIGTDAQLPDDAVHGPHGLNVTDWVDTYVFAATEDVAYEIGAFWAEQVDESTRPIGCEVFTVDADGNRKTVKNADDLTLDALNVSLDSGGLCYIRVYVSDGMGLETTPYSLFAVARVNEPDKWGLMHVPAKGTTEATWKLNKGSAVYPCGWTWIVPVGDNTVNYQKVAGYSTPAAETVNVTKDATAEAVGGIYKDTADPADDTEAKAVKVVPSAKAASTPSHSLLIEDPEDNFKFEAKEGYFYNFTLENIVGDAVFEIKNAAGERVSDGLVTELRKMSFDKGWHILKVRHASDKKGEWEDAAYTLSYSSVNAGAIKFAKTDVSVKENAAYVELVVKRTAKEGAVTVQYCTVAGTAKPQTDYYPVSGELHWDAGKNADQKIRVRLVPDEYPVWEPNKTFTVELKPADGELAEDEYAAQITTPAATVTMTEVSKKSPGSIAVTAGSVDDEPLAFAAKKPAFTVTAGDTLALTLSRGDGVNGKVGVRVQTVKGTALADSDFEPVDEEIVWEDGDCEDKTVEIMTTEQEDQYKESKAFTVKLTALSGKGYADFDKAKVGTSSVSVTVRNNLVEATVETFAKAQPKSGGISVKASKAGTWYIDQLGDLVTVPCARGGKAELTLTLSGPGLFIANPILDEGEGNGKSRFVCKIGKEAEVDCSMGDEIARLVPSGSTTVKFSLVSQTDGAVARLCDCDGAPYVWIPFGSVTSSSPADKARVLPSADGLPLSWNAPDMAGDYGVVYRVLLGSDKKLKDVEPLVAGSASSCVWEGDIAAGKTWYWRVDYGRVGENEEVEWVEGKSVWSFATTAENAAVAAIADGQTDALGVTVAAGTPAILMQGVKASVELSSEADGADFSVLSGKLPDGMKIVHDKVAGVWCVSGVPTKAGEYTALVQAKVGKVAGTTVELVFDVQPMILAAGSFDGLFTQPDDADYFATNGIAGMARVTLTTTAAGKLSAKVLLAGKTYNFAATGFDAVSDYDADLGRAVYSATLTQLQKIGKATYTNTLEVAVENASGDDLEVIGRVPSVMSRLMMAALPDAKGGGAQYMLEYTGNLMRDNSKADGFLAAVGNFAGYYTLGLCPPSGTTAVNDGVPAGNGYLTLTLDAKGKVKVAGVLADGTAVSLSSTASILGVLDGEEGSAGCIAIVPVYLLKGQSLFGGYLHIVMEDSDDEGVPVFKSVDDGKLVWLSDDPASTYSGKEGFMFEVTPVGGWYDTVMNLQAHYLSSAFTLGLSDELPEELLASGYQFAVGGTPSDVKVDLVGDSVSVDKKSIVKEEGSKTRYDFIDSVNPFNVTLKFKRATGILTGTFSVWSDDGVKQKEIAGFKHSGVLLLSRSAESSEALSGMAWTAGHCLAPAIKLNNTGKSRTWKASLPFNVIESVGDEVFDGIDNWGEGSGE